MPQMGEVVAKYVELRDKKAEIESKVKEQVAEIRQQLEQLEVWIQMEADKAGVTSFKTDAGTAFVTTTDFASIADFDAMVEWVKKNDAYEVFERRVSKNAIRQYVEEHNAVPPGVSYGTKLGVNVRRPARRG